MEKDISVNTYMVLDSKKIESVREEAEKSAKENDYVEGELLFEDLRWDVDELYFDREEKSLMISGDLHWNGKRLGYFSPTIPLGSETIIEIIEHYMKKLGKLKTVMEAIKD